MPGLPALENKRRLLRNARREALIVLGVWAVFLAWAVGYSYLNGYRHAPGSKLVELGAARPRDAGDYASTAGVPDWVFAGIIVPWVVATLFTAIFGLVILRRDDLGAEEDAPSADAAPDACEPPGC